MNQSQLMNRFVDKKPLENETREALILRTNDRLTDLNTGADRLLNHPMNNNKLMPTEDAKYSLTEEKYDNLIIPILKQFIYKLKKQVHSKNIKNLENFDYQLINDNASNIFEKPLKGRIQITEKFFTIVNYFTDIFPIINPFGTCKMIWDILHLLEILFLFFWIPIEICFTTHLEKAQNLAMIIFFIIDIVLNFNTAYYQNGFLNFQRKTIRLNYLQNYLWSDIFTTLIFVIDYMFHAKSGFNILGAFKIAFYLRTKTMDKIYEKMIEIFKIKHTSLLDLFNLLFFSFFILHVFACLWYLLAIIYEENVSSQTWLNKTTGLMDEKDYVKYLYSLYWATVTIMTVGYGDISAVNKYEVAFSTITIFFGCVLFGYIINTIGLIIGEINKEKSIFK